MATPIELVINGRDNTSGMFSSAAGGLASIGNIAMGILTSQVFTQLASKATEFLGSIVTEAREAQKAQAQTNAVLQSTGGIAGITAQEVSNYADAVAAASAFTDDQVRSGENMLLTFTNIGKDVFPMATQTMADMSAALGQDLTASAMQLGKALNDPIQGVAALRRVGVQLTDQQEDQVKAFMDAGDAASAQKLILEELGREFGGSAKAQANSWDLLSHKFDDVKEKLGNALLPTIDKVGDVLGKALDNPVVQQALDRVAKWVGDNAPKMLDAVLGLADGFAVMEDPVGGVINLLYRLEGISPIFADMAETVANFGQLLDKFGAWWRQNSPQIIAQGQRIGQAINKALEQISAKLTPFIDQQLKKFEAWFSANGPLIMKVINQVADNFVNALPFIVGFFDVLMPFLDGAITLILDFATIYMQVFTGDLPGAWQTAQNAAKNLAVNITKTFTAFVNWVMSFFGTNLKNVTKVWQDNFTQLQQIVSKIMSLIQSAITNKIAEIAGNFNRGVQDWIATISEYIGNFTAVGEGIIQAIQSGITSGAEAFTAFLQGVINAAINAALKALGLPPLSGESNNIPGETNTLNGESYGPPAGSGVALLRRPQLAAASMVTAKSNTYNAFYNFGTYNGTSQPGNNSLDKFRR